MHPLKNHYALIISFTFWIWNLYEIPFHLYVLWRKIKKFSYPEMRLHLKWPSNYLTNNKIGREMVSPEGMFQIVFLK